MRRTPFRSGNGPSAAELRMTLWVGACVGLLCVNVARWTAPAPAGLTPAGVSTPFVPPGAVTPDPWAESRRSAEILRGQEGAPPPRAAGTAGAGPGERTGTERPVASMAGLRVVDGDTFWLGGEKIRIADIDTPETHPPRCAYEAELGARATRRLQMLLAEAPFTLAPIGGRDVDRYGRKLRIVTRGGRSLGDVLVAEGLARTWTGRREPWCA
jgi:micrococcal nuclease